MGTGSLSKNFQQGARSEYLAQYVFSAFGTAVPVPRPEDAGIDLMCTLGQTRGKRFWVENYYYLQVKSDEKDIVYDGRESVRWLLSLKLPLLICLVSKSGLSIEVFQIIGVHGFYSGRNLQKIVLSFNQSRKELFNEYFGDRMFPRFSDELTILNIDLGKPILSFEIEEMATQNKVDEFRSCLESWIAIYQRNLDNLSAGFEMIEILDFPYSTNQVLPQSKTFGGNPFSLSEGNRIKYKDFLYKSLSTLLLEIAKERDVEKFDEVRRLVGQLITTSEGRFRMGAIKLVYRENMLSRKLGLQPYIHNERVNIQNSSNFEDIEL